MTQQLINVGSVAGDGTGSRGQVPGQIINSNCSELYSNAVYLGTDSGAANAYLVSSYAPAPASGVTLVAGLSLRFTPGNANTGPATLNFAATGYKAIVNSLGNALSGGELPAGAPVTLLYNGAAWVLPLLSIAALQQILNPLTAAESTAGVTPTNYAYPAGDLRRYGGTGGPIASGIPATDDSTAFSQAVSTGLVILPAGYAWRINTGQSFSGTLIMQGYGAESVIYNDSHPATVNGTYTPLLTLTNGANSKIRDFTLNPLTTPFVIQRNLVNTVNTTGNTTANAGTITVASATGIAVGMRAYGPGVSDGTTVVGVSGTTITLYDANKATTSGSPVQFYSITFNRPANIAGISQASAAVITLAAALAANPYAVGQTIAINGVGGMTQINGLSATISAIGGSFGAFTVTVPINSTGFTAYTSGGQATTALPTFQQTLADGFRPPGINDTDVWGNLSTGQQSSTQYGPVLSLTGNRMDISGITGIFAHVLCYNCNYTTVHDCDLKAGWQIAGIGFLSSTTARCVGNAAINNRVRECQAEGIMIMGQDNFRVLGNYVYGCGDSGIETYQGDTFTGLFDSGSSVTSANNQSIGNYAGGGFTYFSETSLTGDPFGYNTASSSSTGDYAAWNYGGSAGFTGSGWNVTGLVSEYNGANGLVFIGGSSNISNCSLRENGYLQFGSFGTMYLSGSNINASNCRIHQETGRTSAPGAPNYSLAVSGSTSEAGAITLTNIDLRDNATQNNYWYFNPTGIVHRNNVRLGSSVTYSPATADCPPTGQPYAQVHLSSGGAVTLAVNAGQVIPFDTVDIDLYGTWDATNHRFIGLPAGQYLVNCSVLFNAFGGTTTTTLYLYLDKNSNAPAATVSQSVLQAAPSATGQDYTLSASQIITVTALTDSIQAYAALGATGSTYKIGPGICSMTIQRLGD